VAPPPPEDAPSARIGPSFEEAIELLARARPARIVVVPYFLFAGRLIERLGDQVEAFRARYPWLKTGLHRTSVRTSACFRSSTSGSGKPWTAIGLCPVIMVAM
jgi:hypothetical protein